MSIFKRKRKADPPRRCPVCRELLFDDDVQTCPMCGHLLSPAEVGKANPPGSPAAAIGDFRPPPF